VRFRRATEEDVRALAALKLRADATHVSWVENPRLSTLEVELPEWQRRLEHGPSGWMEVALGDGGEIIGVCAFMQAREQHDRGDPIPGRAHINAVFVDPAHHRRGIARALLARADAAMRERGYREAQLWTLEGSPAEELYRALGWAPDGRRMTYPPMGLPIVAYVKALEPSG
jgi:GNAT superfamily N-acetyltransferase